MYVKVYSIMNIHIMIKHTNSKRLKMDANNLFDEAIKYREIWFNLNAHKYKVLFKLSLHTSIS